MHVNQITEVVKPIIDSFPHRKLFFNAVWLESYSFEASEVSELEKVSKITPTPYNFMASFGYVHDENGNEFVVYAIYSYKGKVHFLTLQLDEGTYTFVISTSSWVRWTD